MSVEEGSRFYFQLASNLVEHGLCEHRVSSCGIVKLFKHLKMLQFKNDNLGYHTHNLN